MTVFLIVIAIIALFLGMSRRSKSKVYMDNDNAHLFNDKTFKQDKTITKSGLKEEIEQLYSQNKFKETRDKINQYLNYYREDAHVNFLMVFSLVECRDLSNAEKFAHNVVYKLDSDKIGYYLLGYVKYAQNDIPESIAFMKDSLNLGLPKNSITEVIHDDEYLDKLFNQTNTSETENEDLPF